MGFYTLGDCTFGDCASCADLYGGGAPTVDTGGGAGQVTPILPPLPASIPPPPFDCRPRSRWWLWLLIGAGLGYVAND